MIAAAIFAARDLAQECNGGRSPRAIAAAANAIDKAKFLVEEIERASCDPHKLDKSNRAKIRCPVTRITRS
jgi:hypothetical protein